MGADSCMPRQSLWLGNTERELGLKVRSRRFCRNFWHCFCAIVGGYIGVCVCGLKAETPVWVCLCMMWHSFLYLSPAFPISISSWG